LRSRATIAQETQNTLLTSHTDNEFLFMHYALGILAPQALFCARVGTTPIKAKKALNKGVSICV
jgi:hypothetical protein